MSLSILSGSNNPETTHVLMGVFKKSTGEIFEVDLNIETILDPAKKAIYDAFFNFVGSYVSVNIINSPYEGDFNHVTPLLVEEDAITIDYNLLSQNDKSKIDNGFGLLEAL